jgi:hypothetical protein
MKKPVWVRGPLISDEITGRMAIDTELGRMDIDTLAVVVGVSPGAMYRRVRLHLKKNPEKILAGKGRIVIYGKHKGTKEWRSFSDEPRDYNLNKIPTGTKE